ncbi:MAG: hypothetical protein AB1451_14275 [Nitrospirota bacterium]
MSGTCSTCEQIVARFAGAGIRPLRVAIKCRRCGAVHRHHASPSSPPLKARRSAKAAAALAHEVTYERLLAVTAGRKSRPYSVSGIFRPNDVIEHPTFGLGVVTHLLAGDKIQVVFKNGDKLLVCRR